MSGPAPAIALGGSGFLCQQILIFMQTATDFLHQAAALIEARAADRDLPVERSMRRAVTAFNTLTGADLSEVQGWVFMAVLKLSRAQGGRFCPDDYLDGAAYLALALECVQEAPSGALEAIQNPRGVSTTSFPEPTPQIAARAAKRASLLQMWLAQETAK